MSKVNAKTTRGIIADIQQYFKAIPAIDRLPAEDQKVVGSILDDLIAGSVGVFSSGNLDVGCFAKNASCFKLAYYNAAQLRLKHLLAIIDDRWNQIVAYLDIAKNAFDDFDNIRSMHQDAIMAYERSCTCDASDRLSHFDELKVHISNLVLVEANIEKGFKDFLKARNEALIVKKGIPRWAIVVGAIVTIIAALIGGCFTFASTVKNMNGTSYSLDVDKEMDMDNGSSLNVNTTNEEMSVQE